MSFTEAAGKLCFRVRYGNEIKMIGYQAPGKNCYFTFLSLFFYEL